MIQTETEIVPTQEKASESHLMLTTFDPRVDNSTISLPVQKMSE